MNLTYYIWDLWSSSLVKVIKRESYIHPQVHKQLIKLDPSTKLSLPIIKHKYNIVKINKNKKLKRINQPIKYKTLNRYLKNFKS